MTISGAIITKNVEEIIADSIDSISFCDEILIIDNNSNDRTVEIAKKMGATVHHLSTNDFSKLRNFGKEKANGSWILYIDADERVTQDLAKEIKNAVIDSPFAAFRLPRQNFYLRSSQPWPKVEKMERLFKRGSLIGWTGKIHESPKVDGEIGTLRNYLLHHTHSNLSSMLDKTIQWSDVEAENRFRSHHPRMSWWRFPRIIISTFLDYYIRQRGFKLGTVGLVESIYQAYSSFITYAKLWEKQRG